ncbi:C2H2 zinc finger [Ceratobasidium sp. AG-Ba]|nr:C2H2 zinc finger [Ceratobasidium sp. AG-Ba]
MRDTQSKTTPSSSRSLPPLRPDTLDRGRPKSRATDPDSHARAHKNANSVSLPPIRPAVRGSRDEEHGPLPGISAIILQADANPSKHFDPPIPRRPSENSQRAYYHSPIRDQNSARRAGSSSQNRLTITQHRRSQDSISTPGADDSSRPSSPEAPSALSSSFASIKTASSLSSILEDRSACGSPPPMLPSFAHIDAHPSSTLPPIGSGHVSPRSSVFELSDLRTHLPVDDSTVRVRPTPRSHAALDSPKSTPLPLSRPMSPTGHAGSSKSPQFNLKPATINHEGHAPHHKKAPSHDKVPTNKKSLFLNEVPLAIKAPSHKDDDSKHALGHHNHKSDQPATGGGSPILSPIKIEFDPIENPASPMSRVTKDPSYFFDAKHGRAVTATNDRPRGLHVNTDYDQDTMSSCTPTQTVSHSSQLPTREHSPLSGVDSSPVTSTASTPHTPVMRGNSPLAEPSSSSTSSYSDTGIHSPRPASDPEDEDIKPIITKPLEVEGEKPVGAGASYAERRAKRRGEAAMIDPGSIQTRGFAFDYGHMGMHPSMGMGMNLDMGMGIGGMNRMVGMGGLGGMGNTGMGMGNMTGTGMGMGNMTGMPGVGTMGIDAGMGMGMGMGMNAGIGHTPSMTSTYNPVPMQPISQFEMLESQAHQMRPRSLPVSDVTWSNSMTPSMPVRGPAEHLARQQLLRQKLSRRQQAMRELELEQAKDLAELRNGEWGQNIPSQNMEPILAARAQPDITQMLSTLQSIPQDDMTFMQQPQAQIQPQAQSQISRNTNFDIPYPNDPVPAYTDHGFTDFNTAMHTSLVPPVHMSTPANDPLKTPAATPDAPTPVVFRQPTEESTGKGDGDNSGSGTGAHKCDVCGKKFRRPSGLKDHKNIHSGDKPYCCPLDTCRKGFATRSNMIRHHNKTHPSRPKIGGVADIVAEEEYDVGEHESSPAASTSSGGGGSSSQNRFRVVQPPAGIIDNGGVGPARGSKDRRAIRKSHPTVMAA